MPDDAYSSPRAFADVLGKEIAEGIWKAGTVRTAGDLARRFGTTRHHISETVQRLRGKGLVETRTGGGGGIAPRGTMPPSWSGGTRRSGIRQTVRERISDGTYPAGEPLPSHAALGKEFGVAKSTMHLLLDPFKDEGILTVTDGRTWVTKSIPAPVRNLEPVVEEGTSANMEPQRGADRA